MCDGEGIGPVHMIPRQLLPSGNSLTQGQLCLGARSDANNCSHEFFVASGQL